MQCFHDLYANTNITNQQVLWLAFFFMLFSSKIYKYKLETYKIVLVINFISFFNLNFTFGLFNKVNTLKRICNSIFKFFTLVFCHFLNSIQCPLIWIVLHYRWILSNVLKDSVILKYLCKKMNNRLYCIRTWVKSTYN